MVATLRKGHLHNQHHHCWRNTTSTVKNHHGSWNFGISPPMVCECIHSFIPSFLHSLIHRAFHWCFLPVPFPGTKWLDRFPAYSSASATAASSATTAIPTDQEEVAAQWRTRPPFVFRGQSYSSVYAAMLNNDPSRHPARNLNCYINSIFIPTAIAEYMVAMTQSLSWAHYMISYLRNFLAGMVVYYGTAGIFHYFCYVHTSTSTVFRDGRRPYPSRAIMWNQVQLAQGSLFLYTLLPVLDDYLIEQNITQMYYTVQEVGGYGQYVVIMLIYFALVEVGIYWMHRTLHTNKTLYKHIHLLHHQYNKPETLTPWASIAFHPLDGILQASPYEFVMFFWPCHYLSHLLLIFATAVWATYIHDAMDWNVDPIMGAKYHTVHHTHYIYNYGQVFTFCDRVWGTLRVPVEPTGSTKQKTLKKLD
jgi:Delta7-sterol 5-desaturase